MINHTTYVAQALSCTFNVNFRTNLDALAWAIDADADLWLAGAEDDAARLSALELEAAQGQREHGNMADARALTEPAQILMQQLSALCVAGISEASRRYTKGRGAEETCEAFSRLQARLQVVTNGLAAILDSFIFDPVPRRFVRRSFAFRSIL